MQKLVFSASTWNLFVAPALRHGTTVLGTWLAAQGVSDASTSQAIVGGVMAAGAVAWSVASKLAHKSDATPPA